jgi:hypothetical protein
VQQDVDQMITQWQIAPELVFDPKDAMSQWVVLLRSSRFDPDASQAIQGTQFRFGDVAVIVPDRFHVACRLVGKYRNQN